MRLNTLLRDMDGELAACVPRIDLDFDGNCRQALGLDLPVVAINLRHRTDRWAAIQARMAAAGLTRLIQAPAVEGARLSDEDIGRFMGLGAPYRDDVPKSHLSLTRPAVGCFLSHLAIWKWVIANNLPRVLVFEDDARPAPGYDPMRLRDTIASLPETAGLVFPGCLIMGGLAEHPAGPSHLARLYYFNGTFAYLITPAACRFLIARMFPLAAHVDHQLSRLFLSYRKTFPVYHLAPPFFEPDWSLRSDCYVPLADDAVADKELGALVDASRQMLIAEGRPLLPLAG